MGICIYDVIMIDFNQVDQSYGQSIKAAGYKSTGFLIWGFWPVAFSPDG